MENVGKSLLKGAGQALAYAKGKKIKARAHKVSMPTEADVKSIYLHDVKMHKNQR